MPSRSLLLSSSLTLCLACATVEPSGAADTLDSLDGIGQERALNQLFGMNEANCTQPIELDPEVRHYVLESGTTSSVRFPAGAAQPIVIASPPNTYGVFLFRHEARGWKTYFVAAGALPQALRLSHDGKTLYVVSMWSREAPGDYYVAALPVDGGTLSCATLPRPLFQRSLDHGAFAALSIDERGQGSLVTKATLEREEERSDVEWYRYRTIDDGRSFSPPERRGPPSEPLADLPVPASATLDPALLTELLR